MPPVFQLLVAPDARRDLDPRVSRYYVLGIFPREFNYESKDERTRRVIIAYESLGIPTWR